MIERYDGSPKSSNVVVYNISGEYSEILKDFQELTNTLYNEYGFKISNLTTSDQKSYTIVYKKK